MAKGLNRIALYELVNKTRFNSAQQKALAEVEYRKTGKIPPVTDEPEPQSAVVEKAAEKTQIPARKPSMVWSTRPKAVRLYPDRIEICFSWQAAIIGMLVLAAGLLGFFRLGQIYSLKKTEIVKKPLPSIAVENIMPKVKPAPPVKVVQEPAAPKMVEPMGDNVIVIASHPVSSHLEPVKQYFAEFGIATEIINKDNRFLLVTQERFQGTETPRSDGFEMKKKIMNIGAKYKPPVGSRFETFGPKPFQDAYGMKIN